LRVRPLVLDGVAETEIGWHVRKTYWSQGFATEAAVGVLGAAFTRYAQPRLVALVPPNHLASRRVAAKIGMCEQGVVEVEDALYVRYVRETMPAKAG
jgi:RimJ/RimL family protein N-acetyltransferase